jgi:hypothetical protein
MEHRDRRHNDEAALYARIIVGWHAAIGVDEWQRRFGREFGQHQDERFVRYQHAVARFHDSDLADPAVQLAIAREQIVGVMEWAYSATVPEQLPGFEGTQPFLGDVARKLKQLASPSHEEEQRSEGRTVVRYSGYEELLAKAREMYARVTGTDVHGAGGTSFLLSCSLERSEPHGDGEMVLLSPEVLGVSPAPPGRPSDLLEQLRSEGLEILDVTGSSSS